MSFSVRVAAKSLIVHAIQKVIQLPFHLRRAYYRFKYGPEDQWTLETVRKVYLPTGLDSRTIKGIRMAGVLNRTCQIYGLPLGKSNAVRAYAAYTNNQNTDLLIDNVFGHFFNEPCTRRDVFEVMMDWDDLNIALLPHKLPPDELAKFQAWLDEPL